MGDETDWKKKGGRIDTKTERRGWKFKMSQPSPFLLFLPHPLPLASLSPPLEPVWTATHYESNNPLQSTATPDPAAVSGRRGWVIVFWLLKEGQSGGYTINQRTKPSLCKNQYCLLITAASAKRWLTLFIHLLSSWVKPASLRRFAPSNNAREPCPPPEVSPRRGKDKPQIISMVVCPPFNFTEPVHMKQGSWYWHFLAEMKWKVDLRD